MFTAADSQSQGRVQADEQSMTRSFRGLKIDDRGGITYHGATSFFHLPSDGNAPRNDQLSPTDRDGLRRVRLVTNAWQQRALENLSEIPVRSLCAHSEGCRLRISRNRSNIF